MIRVPTWPPVHLAFDALAWAAGLLFGRFLYSWRLKPVIVARAASVGPGYFACLAAGAAVGGWLAGSLVSLAGPAPTLSHSIAGVLAGGIVGVEIYKLVRGVRGATGSAFTGPLALGIPIGRCGCLFAGVPDNTYGSPTALPWAVDLGDGVGRHPVQVYEALAMTAFLAIYLWGLSRRQPWAVRRGFYVLCIWYGAQRFAWEFLKPYPSLLSGLDLFQFVALGLVAYGWIYFARDAADERSKERALSVPRADHEPV